MGSDPRGGGLATRTPARNRRVSTETKASWKTTEFWLYVVVAVGILIASMTVGSDSSASNAGNSGNVGDYFRADKAWLFITLLTIGYLLSRGLAKSGSRDFYDDSYDAYGGDNNH